MAKKGKYKELYFERFGYCSADVILCEVCNAEAIDLHHVTPKGMGKSQAEADQPENIIALCRDCHLKAHFQKKPYLSKAELKEIHSKIL